MTLPPERWGPAFWLAIHAAADAVDDPAVDGPRFVRFCHAASDVLPCPQCRWHFKQDLAQKPPDTSSRAALVEWAIAAHNRVRRRQWKRQLTHAEALAAIQGGARRGPSAARVAAAVVTVVVLVALAAAFLGVTLRRRGRLR